MPDASIQMFQNPFQAAIWPFSLRDIYLTTRNTCSTPEIHHGAGRTRSPVVDFSGFDARQSSFDNVVTDVMMEPMNGIQAAFAISPVHPECQVVVIRPRARCSVAPGCHRRGTQIYHLREAGASHYNSRSPSHRLIALRPDRPGRSRRQKTRRRIPSNLASFWISINGELLAAIGSSAADTHRASRCLALASPH
jgi:hypothetical protein